MKAVLRREYMLAALLIAVSLIVVIPIPSHAAPLTQTQPVTINAAGQATRITDNGLSGSATLTLKANAYNDSNHLLQIQNATGSLQIGSTNYTITNGHGNANKFGDIFLIGDTNPDNGQLFLHGTLKGNSLAFDSPASRLSSLASLALNGSMTTGTLLQTGPVAISATSNSTVSSMQSNTTLTRNMTLTTSQSNSVAANVTQSTVGNATLAGQGNVTESVTLSRSNSTSTSSSSNQTIPYSPVVSSNVTVTMTHTVANITINHTVTVTVANVTITQTNMTSTVNATATVTNPSP
jgi:hypothetical protein